MVYLFYLTLKESLIKIDLKLKFMSKVTLFGAFSNTYKNFYFFTFFLEISRVKSLLFNEKGVILASGGQCLKKKFITFFLRGAM